MLTNIFSNNLKLHKFATTNSNFEKKRLIQTCVIVKRTCISIFSKLGLVGQSKPCTLIYLQKIPSCINLQLPIVILKESILLNMHHHETYMYINFQQNLVNRSNRAHKCFRKKRKLHKFATANSIFLNRLFQTCIIVKRTCISIFSKIGLVDQSKPCKLIYLQKIESCINLQLPIKVIFKKINYFRHASS